MSESAQRVTLLLRDLKGGSDRSRAEAREALWPLVYDELRRMARAQMRDQPAGHTLQATALVHEAYVRLVDADLAGESRGEFFGLASRAMRNLLVDHARGRARAKRGGGVPDLTLDEALLPAGASADRLIELDDALTRLAEQDRRKAEVVELHYFGGMTYDEIAARLGVSLSTVRGDMRFALAWLTSKMSTE